MTHAWILPKRTYVNYFTQQRPDEAKKACEGDLTGTTICSVVAEVEQASEFGERCAPEATRLGLTDPRSVCVLSDGAEWIWILAERGFDGASR